MKRLSLVLFLLSGITVNAFTGNDFDKLKTLAGRWEAASAEGKVQVTFQVVSNGTALLETLVNGPESMVTMYHQDGENTLMTHYCSAGNQPRMRAANSGGSGPLAFQFVDVANLKEAQSGHMLRLVIRFQDSDHLTQEWTYLEKGKESTLVFKLQRVK